MDQEAWNEIYADLERDVASGVKRGGGETDTQIFIDIDRVRFAIDKGENSAAIGIIQNMRRRLEGDGEATRAAGPTLPTLDRLDALEDRLHGEIRLGSARLEIVGEDEEPETRAASRNTKVNRSTKFEDIGGELVSMFDSAVIRDDKRSAVRDEADKVVANRKVYDTISADTKVPWWFIGLIHGMECSFSLKEHLHNGDPLKARTWQVPAGRPKTGNPPFTFHDSAVDALQVDGFAGQTDWPLAMVLYRLERYNGWGYRKKFGFASPYLWSYTNHFTSGKYVKDGVFDPEAPSKQCGAAAMLKDLIERKIVTFEVAAPAVAVAAAAPVEPAKPTSAPTPQPAPAAAATAAAAAQSAAPSAPAVQPVPASPPPTISPPSAMAPVAPPAPSPAAPPPTVGSAPAPAAPPPSVPAPPPAGQAPAAVASAAGAPGVSPAVAEALAALAAAGKTAPAAAVAAPADARSAAAPPPVVSALSALARAAGGVAAKPADPAPPSPKPPVKPA